MLENQVKELETAFKDYGNFYVDMQERYKENQSRLNPEAMKKYNAEFTEKMKTKKAETSEKVNGLLDDMKYRIVCDFEPTGDKMNESDVKLLEMGLIGADNMNRWIEKRYYENPTMLKVIFKFANKSAYRLPFKLTEEKKLEAIENIRDNFKYDVDREDQTKNKAIPDYVRGFGCRGYQSLADTITDNALYEEAGNNALNDSVKYF